MWVVHTSLYLHHSPYNLYLYKLNTIVLFSFKKPITFSQHQHNKHRKLKLPFFYVNLEPVPNNRDLFDIYFICYAKIKFENPLIQKEIIAMSKILVELYIVIIVIIIGYATFVRLSRNLQFICIFIQICKYMQKKIWVLETT